MFLCYLGTTNMDELITALNVAPEDEQFVPFLYDSFMESLMKDSGKYEEVKDFLEIVQR